MKVQFRGINYIGHRTQNEDRQNKNTTQTAKKMLNTYTYPTKYNIFQMYSVIVLHTTELKNNALNNIIMISDTKPKI